ncbi:hypothetical protein J40TS1_34300 [Paenibacillus montaniterrae]|uniref:Uncharacterized protein n=1 Tax=Paenibacillus montaniterrae TaxID=429341 RepID=A0A919YPR1_9BACL|nr:hypothetical protein [Paenibacillus montaniterrae]GIP17788.1 hypothetical protein J40TS1_34300 [Paenibacillus montaniterrae]
MEKGVFFCNNCGDAINKVLPYKKKPTEDCKKCGFDEWIFEPIVEVEGDEKVIEARESAKQLQQDLISVNDMERMLIAEHPIPVGKAITEYKKAINQLNEANKKLVAVKQALSDGVQPCPGGVTGEQYRAWLYSVLPFLEESELDER